MSLQAFEVLVPSYTDLSGKTYKRGDIVRSPFELDITFRNAFKPVEVYTPPPVEKEKEKEKEEEVESDPRGEDVTDLFTEAVEYHLEVFRKDRKYNVYIKGENSPENASPMKKVQVSSFITENFSEDEE